MDDAITLQPNAMVALAIIKRRNKSQRLVPMPSDLESEISQLLFVSFEGDPKARISNKDLARMWSLELQWFSPEDSLSLVAELRNSGWIVGDDDSLSPFGGFEAEAPEMGWQPFLPRDLNLPKPSNVDSERHFEETEESDLEKLPEKAYEQFRNEESLELATLISSLSGLEREEVIRRAKRKKRALGPVTLEMALLLLAREQNLEMERIIGAD